MKNSAQHNPEAFTRHCIEWDVTNWKDALVFWEKNIDLAGRPLDCLELGGRGGGLSLWLASKGNKVICSDLQSPEELARPLHASYGVEHQVQYEAIDATQIPYTDRFDVVVFKSIIGGIARNGRDDLKRETFNQIFKALKPGGHLLFAENLEASALHRLMRRAFTRWGEYWNYVRHNELPGLLSPFENARYEEGGFLGAFGRTESQRRLLGKADHILFNSIVPARTKYIVYGVATKPKK